MIAETPFGLPGGLVALAVAAFVLLVALRGIGYIARVAVWLTELWNGPEELYSEGWPAEIGVPRFGTAHTALAPRGKVAIRGELWDAEADEDASRPVAAGSPIEVVERRGMVLRVRLAPSSRGGGRAPRAEERAASDSER